MTTTGAFRHDVADAVLSLPVAAALGLTFLELAEGRAVTRLPWRPDLSHTPGAFQANPIAALADFTGVSAGITLLPAGSAAATVDYTAKFLAEARGDHLLARGRVLRPGSTLTVAAVEVYADSDGTETLCATVLVTMRNLPVRPTEPATGRGRRCSRRRDVSLGQRSSSEAASSVIAVKMWPAGWL